MNLLAGVYYDPAVAVNKVATALLAMTVLDNVNLRNTFTAPPSGRVKVVIRGGVIHGATTFPQILVGCIEATPSAGTVRGRMAPQGGGFNGTALATTQLPVAAEYIITGLTPGQAYTWDLAYGVEILLAATGWKYGGPNNTTTNDAFGGISFEIWDPSPIYTPASGVPPTTTVHQKIDVIDDFMDTEIAAIKAKTDNLPADPADASDVMAAAAAIQADTDDIQNRLPAALVSGRIAAIAQVVSDKTGYSLSTAPLDAAGIRTALGFASANFDTQIGTLLTTSGYTAPDNAAIVAIKAKTDGMTFTAAGFLDANVLKINGVTITGDGSATPFGV